MSDPRNPLQAGSRVLRLVRRIPVHLPEPWLRPTHEAFKPSSGDEREAERRNLPISLSVWDRRKTDIAQARAFRGNVDTVPFELDVDAVRESSERTIEVVSDPLQDDPRPGACGHSGITGLDKSTCPNAGLRKARRELLAELAKQVSD